MTPPAPMDASSIEQTCTGGSGFQAAALPATGARRRSGAMAPLACLAALYAVFYAICIFSVPMGDDWRLIATSIHGGSFQAAINSYLTFNPRLTEDLLAWFCGVPYYPMLVWKALNPLFLLWLNYSIVGIAVDRDTISRSRHLWLLLASSLIFFTMGGNRAWNQFWMDGGCNWLWSHTFIAGMFHQLVRACRGKKMGWWRYTLLFVCGVFTGWSTETAALSAGATFGLMALAYFRKGRRGAFVAAGSGLAVGAASFFGSIIFLIGLDSRTQCYGADSLAFSHLSIWEKFLQPIPIPAYNLALPAALLFCLYAVGKGGAGMGRKHIAILAALLAAYTVYALFMAVYPIIILVLLYRVLAKRAERPGTGPADGTGLPHANALWWAALALAFLPLPMSLGWSCHAALLYPSIVLITGILHCANRLDTQGFGSLCKAGAAWSAPYIILAAVLLYGLNRQTNAVHAAVEHALQSGQKEIVVPDLDTFVPDLDAVTYLMDAHVRPYFWKMEDNPDNTLNQWVRLGCGLPEGYRIIFRHNPTEAGR